MVRNRKEKTKGNFDAESMKECVAAILDGESIRNAAERFGLKYQTVGMYVKKFRDNPDGEHDMKLKNDTRKVFTDKQEDDLEAYLIKCSKMFYGLNNLETRKLAYEMAKMNNIDCPKNWEAPRMAGKDWLYGFMKRHPRLSLRSAEGCSIARAISFNKHNVNAFFNNYENLLKRYPELCDSSRIWNMDETKTETNQEPSRVISEKGQKQVAAAVSGERGTLVTTVLFINAAGNTIPPALVFPRVHFKSHMINGAPNGTLGLAHQSGWMTTSNFVHVMQHFIKCSGSSEKRRMLLICDNHESHLSIEAIELARANGVHILTVPPHCTHMMQPLDVGMMKPFKTYYNAAIDSWLMSNPGQRFGIYNVAACVGIAHGRAMLPQSILNSFKKTGIFPVDRHIFTDDMFAPSLVSERPNPPDETLPDEPLTCQLAASLPTVESENPPSSPQISSENFQQPIDTPSTSRCQNSTPMPSQQPGCYLSPAEIRGYPKSKLNTSSKKPREKGKSRIITDTPEKLLLEEKQINKKTQKTTNSNAERTKSIKRKLVENEKNEKTTDDENDKNSDDKVLEEPQQNFDRSELKIEDFVLVKFGTVKQKDVYYVGKIIGKCDDGDVEISFLRMSSKVNYKFFYPIVPDISSASLSEIVALLPTPSEQGSTKRQKSLLSFSVSLENFNMH